MNERMRDSAFAANINPSWTGAVGGYYGGPDAFNVWSPGDWKQFHRNRKLPIWVGGLAGAGEAKDAIAALRDLGVPKSVYTVIDMEGRVDKTYVESFGQASSVFSNPRLNGYWVADYADKGPFMYDHRHVRATQYTAGQEYDSSTVRDWTYTSGPWWV